MNNNDDCFDILRQYLNYIETIKGRSPRTVHAYYIDLRTFFRFINQYKSYTNKGLDFNEIPISNITLEILKNITLADTYEFLKFTLSDRNNNAKTRSRKVSSIRSFFKYLVINVKLLDENPIKDLEMPNYKKSLPKYLTLEQSLDLLNAIDGPFMLRDYCIITLFLNCGMRLSELVGINLYNITENRLKLLGKGNKERIVYLNDSCLDAIDNYLKFRNEHIIKPEYKNALFITKNGCRISARRVEEIVCNSLKKAMLADNGFSPHKLRHTAATLMYQHGNVDIKVLQELLGHVNLGTTEIYTHISSTQLERAATASPLSDVKKNSKK